jgi:hypothetical protein
MDLLWLSVNDSLLHGFSRIATFLGYVRLTSDVPLLPQIWHFEEYQLFRIGIQLAWKRLVSEGLQRVSPERELFRKEN